MRWLALLLLGLLLTPVAAGAAVCEPSAVSAVLNRWMDAQRDHDRSAMEQTMSASALLVATSPALTVNRHRAEFITEKLNEPELAVNVYAYEPMRLDCGVGKTTSRVERRGCLVVRESDGTRTELAQTEVLDMVEVDGKVVIQRSVSMLDAMRVDGKVLFAWNGFVDLPACASALRK